VYISEPDRDITNKIIIPFAEAQIEYDAKKNVQAFHKRIKEHIDNIRINVVGISEIDSAFCLCTSVNTTQIGKAKGMMNTYPLLSSFVMNNDIQTSGLPFVEITSWDMTNDSINYNFCFPIIEKDILPIHNLIKYERLKYTKAIKAIYNGNYITSDRAWYALLQYAEKNGISTSKMPIEFYYNNPNFGVNEKEWRADVYLPIK